MTLELWQWAVALACAVLIGTAKTGVPGLGILVVPVMVWVIGDSLLATGTLLPLLCAADVFAVWYYRRHASAWALWRLFPWVIVGGAAGWLVMDRLEAATYGFMIGAILLAMVAIHVFRKRVPDQAITPSLARAAFFGLLAGFSTMTANAAGPVMNVYLLSMALPKDQFMGTGAWYFLIINLAKVPAYLLLDPPIITPTTLLIDLVVLPGILVGAFWGRWIYERLPQRAFEWTVLTLTAVGGVMLMGKQLQAWATTP